MGQTGRIRLSNNPLIPGPQDFDYEIIDGAPITPPDGADDDMVNLSAYQVYSSPSDIAQWSITRRITKVSMSREEGIMLEFDKPLPENWKVYTGQGTDNFQYTVWAGDIVGSIAGFILMWQGRPGTGRMEVQPGHPQNWPNHFHDNWAYAADRWGPLNSLWPTPGTQMVFLVSAGEARMKGEVTSVRERSNAVVFTCPPNDNGSTSY